MKVTNSTPINPVGRDSVDSLIAEMNLAGVRYLVIGGQAVRLHALPRFSMDWDFFIPPHDTSNLESIGEVLGDDIDIELLLLGKAGQNVIQLYQTCFGLIQFHLAVPGLNSFVEAAQNSVFLIDENGIPVRCVCAQDQQDLISLRELIEQLGQ